MILQELVRYYDRKATDPDPSRRLPAFGFVDKAIPFVIELAPDGRVVQLIDTRTPESGTGKPRAQSYLVPRGVKKTSQVAANLLWDSAEYVIGLDRGRANQSPSPPTAFRARIEKLTAPANADDGIVAVLQALQRADWSVVHRHPAWPEVTETNPLMAFRLVGDLDLICQRPAVATAAASADGGDDGDPAPILPCLVDGTPQPVERLHDPIKGVWNAQSSGANIVSFNAPAFESYGKTNRQGENAPVGRRAAFAYTTALNHLLARNSRNRTQVGDASTVFWADRASRFDSDDFTLADLLGEPRDDPDRGVRAVQALYDALSTGQLPVGERDVRFFVLGLAPNAARISIRFWMAAPFADLAPRIIRHFDDLKVVRRFDTDVAAPSLFRLLSGVALKGKLENAPPRLAGEWMRSILEGRPYPASLLNAAVARCKAEQDVTYLRAAAIKGWLNRDFRATHPDMPSDYGHFKETLDMDQSDAPYRLGRLFATLERVQQQAQPGINATIRDRYYGAASTTPVAVFPTLIRLKNAHLKKLTDGQVAWFERTIGETVQDLTEFPQHLSLAQQGRFALGYYHQRQSFFTRKDADQPANATEN
ncbi:MAG: type I-C CRISPR-associated protein Cas8c/Csd1 [Burkholderiaceae bacterium]|nr:type I-C CRISPR-associated protein Cas8c/Csd1 [Burkholderiaceae bacterium]MEB2352995.1 type I-C CRISPR-associated protein Cas8c/Csd1 [Burkholderiaceae bacterium]